MIDYGIIEKSILYYEKTGYTRIEAPWTVSEYVDNITKPKDRQSLQLKHNNKCLVASGEQSFLYLYLKNFIPKGVYQVVTPCFRFESFDYLHSKYFIKNELINTKEVSEKTLEHMIDSALHFYSSFLGDHVRDIKTEIGYDIVYSCDKNDNVIELGSYGIRSCEFLDWVYGTGCAEPRLSNTIQQHNNAIKNYENRQRNYHAKNVIDDMSRH
jgi:hypothetical protein